MSRLYACVFFVMAITYEAWGQVSSICRPNERLLPCGGCQKTCSDPAPACDAVCRMGCYCNDDEVRNSTGHCIKLADCPPNRMETASSMLRSTTQQGSLRRSSYASWLDNYSKLNDDNQISSEGVDAMDALAAYKRETTEPRPSPPCPENEEYRFCEPCNRTCDNPNNVCPAQCARGCFCKGELVRDADGKCVEFQYCSKFRKYEMSNFVDPIPYRIVCGPYQRYKKCETCEKTCSNPNPSCPNECKKGCFCENGLVKSPSGDCVKLKDCPKAETSMNVAHDLSVEDCGSDEEFLSCGWCEPSCRERAPRCPLAACTRGCLCRPPLLRHHSGRCVSLKECDPKKCIDPNEEYVCRYGCEARCERTVCWPRPRRCQNGCHCRLGYLRDVTGRCVLPANCPVLAETRRPIHYVTRGAVYKLF